MIGLEFVEEKHGRRPVHYSGQAGDTVLELYLHEEDASMDTATRLGFGVPNLSAVMAALATRDVTIVSPAKQTPWGLRAVVRDVDGRSIELYQA